MDDDVVLPPFALLSLLLGSSLGVGPSRACHGRTTAKRSYQGWFRSVGSCQRVETHSIQGPNNSFQANAHGS